eukprot:GILI01028372.1.p1 GENE.GILI01028372.1~~GILI01028372.1.p1  ORF type:complete len:255 (-),score=0.63 GILI01028372.1:35-799(-)
MYKQLASAGWYLPEIVDAPDNSLEPFYPANVVGSIDTIPIHVWKMGNHTFNPKYADVLKVLVATSNTGFCISWSIPFAGAAHDQTILGASDFPIRETDVFLVDGDFSDGGHAIAPWDGREIWSGTDELAHERMMYNEKLAHFRARVEHRFGGTQFNRFNCFSKWKREFDLLPCAVAIVASILNLEKMAQYGLRGCYKPIKELSATEIAKLEKKFLEHKAQTSRYPKEKKKKGPQPQAQPVLPTQATINTFFNLN